jgi:hypothetical protein
MARTSVTEDSLGLTVTDEELATVVTSQVEDDDIPMGDDEPTPVVEAAPVVVKDEKPEPAPADPAAKPEDPKTVDLRALQEARAEAREVRQRNAILEARTNEVLALIAAQQQPAPKAPEVPGEDDVVGRINWLVQERMREQEQTQQSREAQQAEQQRQATFSRLASLEQQFAATAPDYEAAVQFAGQSRETELAIMYPNSTPEQRKAYIANEWEQIVQTSMQSGINPAEQVYNFAKARGFTAPAPVAPTPAQPNLAAVAAAQQRHQSLSDAPGGEVVPPLDAKALARMSDREFKAWMSKKGNESKFEEIMGR